MVTRKEYLEKIRPFYHSELIKVLLGIRRCGKSVLLKQIMEEIKATGVQVDHIIYINFEDFQFADICTAKALYNYIKEHRKDEEKYYLFFDEIQMVSEFERVINSFRATWDVSIFITGSNSRLLSGELATYLSGRYVSFQIAPFSFKEHCLIKQITSPTEEDLNEYIKWGGMPQRYAMHTEEETATMLKDLYNSIVLKDIVQRAGAKDVDLLNRIIEYLMQTPSQTFSAKGIMKYFESINRKVSTETLYNYMEHIQNSMIASKARRYDIRGKQLLTTLDKYYLMDLGLGNIHNTGFKVEYGALLENVIYNELRSRGYEVCVGKLPKGEVDFIATKGQQKEYYQVAYYLYDEAVIQREFGTFSQVPDNYPKYVVSMDRMDFSREGIIHKNAIQFLMEK